MNIVRAADQLKVVISAQDACNPYSLSIYHRKAIKSDVDKYL